MNSIKASKNRARVSASASASSLSEASVWVSSIARTSILLRLLTALKECACANVRQWLNSTQRLALESLPVHALVCPVVKSGASPNHKMASKPAELQLF